MKETHPTRKSSPIECEHCVSRLKGIFCNLDSEILSKISVHKHTKNYGKGDVLFYENMKPFGIHCISSGAVKLYKTNEDGKQTILTIAKPGEVIGFRAIFSGEPYVATGEAIEESQICFIDRTTINELVQQNPTLAMNAIKELSHRLGVYEEKLHSFAHKTVRERLAELLLILKESFGKKEANGVLIDVQLSRAEMAQMIGTAQESFIRLLSEFKEAGYISIRDRHIIVVNQDGIISEANLPVQ